MVSRSICRPVSAVSAGLGAVRRGAARGGAAHHLDVGEAREHQVLQQLAPDAAGADHQHLPWRSFKRLPLR